LPEALFFCSKEVLTMGYPALDFGAWKLPLDKRSTFAARDIKCKLTETPKITLRHPATGNNRATLETAIKKLKFRQSKYSRPFIIYMVRGTLENKEEAESIEHPQGDPATEYHKRLETCAAAINWFFGQNTIEEVNEDSIRAWLARVS